MIFDWVGNLRFFQSVCPVPPPGGGLQVGEGPPGYDGGDHGDGDNELDGDDHGDYGDADSELDGDDYGDGDNELDPLKWIGALQPPR